MTTHTALADVPSSSRRTIDFAWLEVSNRCNLECSHCYASSGPNQSATGAMTLANWLETMDQLRRLGCRSIQLIGGEPTIHPDFAQILRGAQHCGFTRIEVYTNATRLSDTVCSLISECGASIAFSFYSTDPRVHDKITGRVGSQRRTVAGIRKALSWNIPLRAGVVVTVDNRDHVDATVLFLNEMGVRNVRVDREREVGRAAGKESSTTPYDQLCGRCADSSVTIDATGQISPCVFSHFHPIGRFEDGLESAASSRALGDFRSMLVVAGASSCSPGCDPHECGPGDGDGPCFPSGCDPQMCNPDSCPPRD